MGKKTRSRDTRISRNPLHAVPARVSFDDSLASLAMSNSDLRAARNLLEPTIPIALDGSNDIIGYTNLRRRARSFFRSSPVSHKNRYAKLYQFAPSFSKPLQSLICIRRNIRRSVLFASQSGRGSKRFNRPKFNRYSNVRC